MIIAWFKRIGAKMLIKELDQLTPIIAAKMKEAQTKFGQIPSEEFSKELVTEMQIKLCDICGVKPSDIGIQGE